MESVPIYLRVFSFLLLPLSCLFFLILQVRSFFYSYVIQKRRVNAFLISVGNITVGGTGKTPIASFLAKRFLKEGKRVSVISRGYRKRSKKELVSDGEDILLSSQQAGDEAYLLAKNLSGIPVLSGRDRYKLSQRAIKEFSSDVIILDDAFHCLYLKKDLEIVVIDATNPFGNRLLLPAGPLREPLRNLKRADIFWLNRMNLVEEERLERLKETLFRINREAKIIESYYSPVSLFDVSGKSYLPSFIKGKKVWLLAGIGNPSSFEKVVSLLGADIIGKSFFPDHYAYQKKDLECINKKLSNFTLNRDKSGSWFEKPFVLTTEKDFYRLPENFRGLWLKIELKIKKSQVEHWAQIGKNRRRQYRKLFS